jgi:hypothetical protein
MDRMLDSSAGEVEEEHVKNEQRIVDLPMLAFLLLPR